MECPATAKSRKPAPRRSLVVQTTSQRWVSSTISFSHSEPRISAPASMIIHLQAWMRVLSKPVRRKKHMEGDFSRITFNKSNQYSRVLMQQGRVLVDADWNEQAEIMNGALRALITDLVGSHWGMVDGDMAIDAQNNA